MTLPFTQDQLFETFRLYNNAVWPMQPILLTFALVAAVLSVAAVPKVKGLVSRILALLWLWMGLVYHWGFFSVINPAAWLFAVVFILQGLLLLWFGQAEKLTFTWRGKTCGLVASAMLIYALIVYPLLNRALGHTFMQSPTFGLPCPTTIFTLGLFWLTEPPRPRLLLIVPIAWSMIGGSAAFLLDVPQDFGLLVAGLLSLALLFRVDTKARIPPM